MNYKESENFGINISGYINKQFGLGEGVRANIRAIKTTGVPYVLNDFNIDIAKHIKDSEEDSEIISSHNPYDINLVQVNIDKMLGLIDKTDKSYFLGKYNIAFWAWELENFPMESKVFFSLFDEIWVPSNFCAEAVSKIATVPVLKFMHSIEIAPPTLSRSDFKLPEDRFIFLTMFDYYSSIERKNPIGTIDAYEKAFGKNNTETMLVVKSSLSNDFPKEKRKITERIADNKSIILIEEILDRNSLYSLMNCCDCFISLHRSEGFGLTIAEAMYLGKPVIATAYSANTEFMNVNNSFLVKYDMVSTGNKYYYSTERDYWANPDTEHAAFIMKNIYQDPHSAKLVAERGRSDIKNHLAPEKIGEKIKARIKLISHNLTLETNKNDSAEVYLLELEKQILQNKIDVLKNYKPIQMKLAFKNFKNKLTGNTRKYIWE